jgi:hypothetical protein
MMLLPLSFTRAGLAPGCRIGRGRIVEVADQRIDVAIDVNRAAAFLVALGVIADQAHRERVVRFEQELPAHEVAVAIVDVRVVVCVAVKSVAADVDAIDTPGDRLGERAGDAA